MGTYTTSVKLEEDVYRLWKQSGLRLGKVVRLGLMNHNQTPGYVSRIRELEEGNEKLQRKITIALQRINELERAT